MHGYRKSGTLKALKWLSVILLIIGLLTFIFSLVLFAINFNNTPTGASVTIAVLPGFILALLAIGAGVAGASIGVYEGQIHNISSKNVGLALNVATVFSALVYLGVVGAIYFKSVKDVPLSSASASTKAEFGVFVAIFIFAFFTFVVSIILTVISAFWIPKEHDSPQGHSPYSSERNMIEEPYIIREERVPYTKPAYGRKYASSDGFMGMGRPALRY